LLGIFLAANALIFNLSSTKDVSASPAAQAPVDMTGNPQNKEGESVGGEAANRFPLTPNRCAVMSTERKRAETSFVELSLKFVHLRQVCSSSSNPSIRRVNARCFASRNFKLTMFPGSQIFAFIP
jgi:hypothetical protein